MNITDGNNPWLPTPLFRLPNIGEYIHGPTGNIYTFTSRIGEGNFSVVFGCTDIWNNELAAKVLKPDGTFRSIGEKFRREVENLVNLRHPNITYIHDAFMCDGAYYLITERCHGTLDDLFSLQGFYGPSWIIPFSRCILQGIEYIHNRNYAHQDLHFGNILSSLIKDEMSQDRSAITFKIGDLGISKLLHQVTTYNTRPQWLLPPEVINQTEFGPIDHRADIYHAALILLQFAYSQKLSFTNQEVVAGLPRKMALDLRNSYSFGLEKALRRHVQHRTSSARELWRDISTPMQNAELPLFSGKL